jgi:hypothetical protein
MHANATRWGAGGGRGREGGSSELMTVLCCGVHHSLQSFLSNYIFIHTIAHNITRVKNELLLLGKVGVELS